MLLSAVRAIKETESPRNIKKANITAIKYANSLSKV